jgi:hypothetical protein
MLAVSLLPFLTQPSFVVQGEDSQEASEYCVSCKHTFSLFLRSVSAIIFVNIRGVPSVRSRFSLV